MSVSYQWSRRKGTTEQHRTFVGINGELTVDTDKKTVVVHDGVKAGGYPLVKEETLSQFADTVYNKNAVYTKSEVDGIASNLDQKISNLDAVKKTGDETIAGVKTFSSNIVGNITGNSGSATKLQAARTINGVPFDGTANITVSDSTAVNLTDNQTIAGVKTFSSSPIVPTPTTNTQATNKAYVDSIITNVQSLPIGAILNGYTIFANCIVAFGGEFNRADYPKLWAYLQANPSLVKTKTQWQTESTANGGICGFFSDGNGTTTFRVPNLAKAFLRLDSRSVGSYQGDAFKSHTHGLIAPREIGAAYATETNQFVLSSTGAATRSTTATGEAETIPKNIAVLPLIVAK